MRHFLLLEILCLSLPFRLSQDVLRNPRGAFTPHRLRCGDWVLLFYNNGQTEKLGYTGRLVVWLVRGRIKTDQDQGRAFHVFGQVITDVFTSENG